MALDPPFSNYEHEIYAASMLAGRKPARPLDWRELERDAYAMLSRGPRGYIQGGAGRGHTIRANREAFDEWRIVPRMLRDVSERTLERTVLGTKLPAPVLLAPIGVQTVAHPEGELAMRACVRAHVGLPSDREHRGVAHDRADRRGGGRPEGARPAGGRQADNPAGISSTGRATASSRAASSPVPRRAGYEAIVVTLDTWLLGWRPADLTDGFLPFLRGEGNANYLCRIPSSAPPCPSPPEEDMPTAVAYWAWQFSNPSVTWEDLAFLRECTELPIVLKGIQSAEDALLAVEHGIEGIIVSNHGGRQVDGAIGSLQALPGVVEAVGERCEVLFDSGIRSGADALKALALGARAVCLGRPYVWGLALGGEAGVIDVLRAFLADLDLNMALSGHASIDEVGPHTLAAQR